MNWKIVPFFIILAISIPYGVFSYLKWRDRDLWQEREKTFQTQHSTSTKNQRTIEQQIAEMDAMREQARYATTSVTTTSVASEINAMDALRKQATTKTQSPQSSSLLVKTIEQQIAEMDAMRAKARESLNTNQ